MAQGSSHWPVRCAPVGPVAVGSLLWRHGGSLYCTAIVKATFSFPAQGPLQRLNPQPIRRHDDYLSGRPSLSGASELAPRTEKAEVILVGHAYAREPVPSRSVRLTMVRGQKILVDKTLFVYGDRRPGEKPRPFTRMRIGYERALGGLAFSANPVGVGADKDSTRLPNVIDARDKKRRVGGLGPVPARFPRRRKKRGAVSLEDIEGGIADFPPDFDWTYFNAAQRDQRTDRIEGHEWIMLEGLHPEGERVRIRLPHVVGRARIFGASGHGLPDELKVKAELLHLEPDEGRCSLVWRGNFLIPNERLVNSLVIAGAAQVAGEELLWPDDTGNVEGIASPSPYDAPRRPVAPAVDFSSTMFSAGADVELPPEEGEDPPPKISNTVPPPPLSHPGAAPSFPGHAVPTPAPSHHEAPTPLPSETGETDPSSQPEQHWPAFLPPSSASPYAYQPPSTAGRPRPTFEHTEMLLDEADLEVLEDGAGDEDLVDTVDRDR